MALVEVESVLGLFLVFGISPERTRWGAIALFVCFLGVSSLDVLVGAQSCSCFGKIEMVPWVALIFDVFALIALWQWRPMPAAYDGIWHALVIVAGCLALLPLLAWLAVVPRFPQLIVLTPTVDLGALSQGERRGLEVRLRNPHDQHVLIIHVHSSCPCLHAFQTDAPLLVEPGSDVVLPLELDLGREPAFIGPLTIELAGRTFAEESVFRAKVTVNVKKNESGNS